jgi:hypothetical protein
VSAAAARARLALRVPPSRGAAVSESRALCTQHLHAAPETHPRRQHPIMTPPPPPPPPPPSPRRLKLDGPYDSRMLPIILAVTLVTSLMVVFSGAVARLHSDL